MSVIFGLLFLAAVMGIGILLERQSKALKAEKIGGEKDGGDNFTSVLSSGDRNRHLAPD